MTDNNAASETRAPDYSYKPSLIGSPLEFRLTETSLDWSMGHRAGQIPYRDIKRVQLAFRPGTVQQGSFVTFIWSEREPKLTITSTSRRSIVDVTRQDASYRDFVQALHRRLHDAGAAPEYVRGVKPYTYWPGLAFMSVAALGFALLIVRALQTQAWAGAAFIALFLGLFLWQIGGYFRRNRPGRYRPDAVPAELLPGA